MTLPTAGMLPTRLEDSVTPSKCELLGIRRHYIWLLYLLHFGTLAVAHSGTPQSISRNSANLILYLASTESSFTSGAEHVIDGALLVSMQPTPGSALVCSL